MLGDAAARLGSYGPFMGGITGHYVGITGAF
jgi:hypothetical protein